MRYASQAKLWREIAERAPLTVEDREIRRAARTVKRRHPRLRGLEGLRAALESPDKLPVHAPGWHGIKARRIAESGPACEACRTTMPDEGLLHLHHIRPRKIGGTNTEDNAALLCPNCHAKAHWLYRRPGAVLPTCLADLIALLTATDEPAPRKLGQFYILAP